MGQIPRIEFEPISSTTVISRLHWSVNIGQERKLYTGDFCRISSFKSLLILSLLILRRDCNETSDVQHKKFLGVSFVSCLDTKIFGCFFCVMSWHKKTQKNTKKHKKNTKKTQKLWHKKKHKKNTKMFWNKLGFSHPQSYSGEILDRLGHPKVMF